MKHFQYLLCVVCVLWNLVGIGGAKCAQSLIAVRADTELAIDGIDLERVWKKAHPIVIHDKTARVDITVKALYNGQDIFMLVQFPDPDESRTHKSWVWNKSNKVYELGADREDVLVIKWFMEFDPLGLSVFAGKPHKADIWYWKANRTDPTGHADDKMQYLKPDKEKRTTKITGQDGSLLYLSRKGDKGEPAYISKLVIDYQNDREPRFMNITPTGSRADVKAKGVWQDGEWIIEFQRALNTGHSDDLALELDKTYTLGLSRLEIAGRVPDPKADQPLYGSGDIHQAIILSFEH